MTTNAELKRLAELEPRAYQEAYPRDYASGRYGYPLEVSGATNVDLVPTNACHVHVSTPSGQRSQFVYRGRTYEIHFSQHAYFHLSGDGGWKLEHPDPEQNLHRNGAGRLYGAEELPAGGRERLRAEILDAVKAWAGQHNAELVAADQAALNNAARKREEKINELAGELVERLAELDRIEVGAADAPRF